MILLQTRRVPLIRKRGTFRRRLRCGTVGSVEINVANNDALSPMNVSAAIYIARRGDQEEDSRFTLYSCLKNYVRLSNKLLYIHNMSPQGRVSANEDFGHLSPPPWGDFEKFLEEGWSGFEFLPKASQEVEYC